MGPMGPSLQVTVILLVFAAIEIICTVAKSWAITKGLPLLTIATFSLEALIGLGLTANAAQGLQGRKTTSEFYPVVTAVLVVLFELSFIISEALILVYKPWRRGGPSSGLETNGAATSASDPIQQTGKQLSAGSRKESSLSDGAMLFKANFNMTVTLLLMYGPACLVFAVFIAIKRVNLEKKGDLNVELVIMCSMGFALFIGILQVGVLVKDLSQVERMRASGDEINIDEVRISLFDSRHTSLPILFLLMLFLVPALLMLTVAVGVTVEQNIYVDSGVISVCSVLVPGAMGFAMHGMQVRGEDKMFWNAPALKK